MNELAIADMEISTSQTDNNMEIVASKVQEYIHNSKASNTIKAYRSDWADYVTWCDTNGVTALPSSPEVVAAYLVDLVDKGYKSSTIERRLVSISKAHTTAGHDDITKIAIVRETWAGIRRTIGTSQTGKAACVTADLKLMLATLPDSLLGIRDRALLLLGFAGGFRRSELVSLDVEDLDFRREGLVVTLRRSKTDQTAEGRRIGIPYGSNCESCPVRSLQLWLEESGITEGPLFRSVNRHGNVQPGRLSDKSVALIVKRTAEAAGLNPDNYSGHSLRSGMATSAAMNGASERQIMKQTGHRSEQMVRKYIREGSLFTGNAAAQLGL